MNLDWANLFLAGVAAFLGWYSGRAAERRAYRLGATTFTADWHRDLRTWASDAIDVLSESTYAVPSHNVTAQLSPELSRASRARLSALVDRGRFFLPNYNHDEIGTDRPLAYRGLRHPAIDLLVAAHDVLENGVNLDGFTSQRHALVTIRREFVSQIQEILDPRSQNRTIAEIITAAHPDPRERRTALERLNSRQHPGLSETLPGQSHAEGH